MTDYTNVPIAAAGDWIDDTYLNTYLGDNFRAVFGTLTGAGQLLASSAINRLAKVAVTGNNGYILTEDTSQATKMKFAAPPEGMTTGGTALQYLRKNAANSAKEWASIGTVVFYGTNKTNASWDGDSHGTGTTNLTLASFDGAAPSGIKGIILSVSAQWAAAGGGNLVNIRPQGSVTGNGIVVRAHDTLFNDAFGIIGVNASGQFEVIISGASANVYIDVWGYIL